jgi:hypothetical protein
MNEQRVAMLASLLAEAKEALTRANVSGYTPEDVRAIAISLYIQESKDGSKSPARGQRDGYTSPAPQSQKNAPSSANLGVCARCGAPNRWSDRAGKAYCSAKCWLKKDNPDD